MEVGADATRFIQQWGSLRLRDKIPLLGAMNATDQSVIRTMVNAEAEGITTCAHFAEGSRVVPLLVESRNDPSLLFCRASIVKTAAHFSRKHSRESVTQKFVADYEQRYQKLPSIYGFSHYSGAMWIAEALKTIGGKAEDRDALLKAVLSIELKGSPLGKTVSSDKYGNPVYGAYVRRVERRADGKLWNVPIETYPQVSQFWKYDPENYMKQPPYSRTFQDGKG